MDLETSIAQLIQADDRWANVIRACVDWTVTQREKGEPESFRRDTIYFRLGQPDGGVPVLTPLARAGIIARDFTNARGRPYYKLVLEPQAVLNALSRAAGKSGSIHFANPS